MPDFTADADVTITKDEQPAKLKLELKKGGESRAFRELMQYPRTTSSGRHDEFTAPPWATAAEPHWESSRESECRKSEAPRFDLSFKYPAT